LRITIGTPIENQYLLNILEGKSEPKYERGVILSRESRETNISLKIYKHDVWGCSISTGIPFLDHMLEIFSLHSGLSIELKAFGDTNVDYHHTVEDCAILIGKAIRELYRDRGDYQRYAYVLPMDESNTTLSIDLCGRFYLKWDVKFTEERVGDLPTRLIYHFFYTLCANAQLSLHVNTYGEDSHHMIESIFKAFSKSLGLALSNSLVDNGMQPSSKGLID
jgi:imidazoleglycerol phosphate dehydratase HisB